MFKRTLVLAMIILTLAALSGCIAKPGESPTVLSYSLPTTLSIALGEALPGTDIVYARFTEDGPRFTIDGQDALKKVGDSVRWKGVHAPGVEVDLKLRVAHASEQSVRLVGTAKVTISDAAPKAAPSNETRIKYTGPVAYGVSPEGIIPGTPLTYVGVHEESAELGGLGEYPYRSVGDSILWEGSLSANTWIKVDVRVVQFDEKGLRVAGLVTLWVSEHPVD